MSQRISRLRAAALARVLRVKGLLGMNRGVFRTIYRHRMWGDPESISGVGSTLRSTEAVREQLPRIVERFGVRTMLDAACGDFSWMSRMRMNLDQYIGVDIVPELIEQNRAVYQSDTCDFRVLDLSRDTVPQVDLIFCRHCMIHMPLKDIRKALQNFADSGSRFLMATTLPSCKTNRDILPGGFRELNLEIAPFFFPEPLARINDVVFINGEARNDGWLYLWRMADLPVRN